MSAARAKEELKVQIKVDNPEPVSRMGGAALNFRDAYALDATGKRKYPLLKGQTGLYLAEPRSDNNDGGRLFLEEEFQRADRSC